MGIDHSSILTDQNRVAAAENARAAKFASCNADVGDIIFTSTFGRPLRSS